MNDLKESKKNLEIIGDFDKIQPVIVSLMKNKVTQSCIDQLRCTSCNKQLSSKEIHTICPDCWGVLFVEYDLEAAKELIQKQVLRQQQFWWCTWRAYEDIC